MNILPVTSIYGRPTYHYERTFDNGAKVHLQVRPGVIHPLQLEVEVSEARPKFEPGKAMEAYERWRDDCIRNAAARVRAMPQVLQKNGAFA